LVDYKWFQELMQKQQETNEVHSSTLRKPNSSFLSIM